MSANIRVEKMLQNPEHRKDIKTYRDSKDIATLSNYRKFEDQEITNDILEKALLNLGETSEVAEECLHTLRVKIQGEHRNFQIPTEDRELIKFLRATKFDVGKAYNRMKKLYNSKNKYVEVFSNYRPSACEKTINAQLHYILPYRNTDGTPILVGTRGFWKPEELSLEEYFKLDVLGLEATVDSPINQIYGITLLIDCDNLLKGPLFEFTPRRVLMIMNVLQNALPIRYKTVHVVNAPSFFSLFYRLFYPLLSQKLRNRIIIHPVDPTFRSLHEFISPAILPENYGGDLGPMDNSLFKKVLLDKEEYFKDMQKYYNH